MGLCPICADSRPTAPIAAKEMFFGTRERFAYSQCLGCGCLVLLDRPVDLARYYPQDYYAFKAGSGDRTCRGDVFGYAFLRRQRTQFLLQRRGLAGKVLCSLRPPEPLLAEYISWLRACHAGLHSRILDVGCGSGRLVRELSWYGFSDLYGIDAFISEDQLAERPGLSIRRAVIGQVQGDFDCIMLHHSLEHMDDPVSAFGHIARLLRAGGAALVRTPTVSSYAWQRYKENWVQLDPPRHLFLHSLESLKILAHQAGLVIRDMVYDSTEFQFWGSEQYERGIPLNGPRSWCINPAASLFSASQMEDFRQRAAQLNMQGQGDQVCVYLKKE